MFCISNFISVNINIKAQKVPWLWVINSEAISEAVLSEIHQHGYFIWNQGGQDGSCSTHGKDYYNFGLRNCVQTGSGVHPASYSMGTVGHSPGDKAVEA
jgi:hypothetical protein